MSHNNINDLKNYHVANFLPFIRNMALCELASVKNTIDVIVFIQPIRLRDYPVKNRTCLHEHSQYSRVFLTLSVFF